MKKSLILLSISVMLFSCGNKIPKDIQDFLANMLMHEEDVKEGHFTQTLSQNINGISGGNTIKLDFHYGNSKDFGFTDKYEYSGSLIKDGIATKTVTLTYKSENNYEYKVETNLSSNTQTFDRKDAYNEYYKRIFDNGSGGGMYKFGGLYYGDFIAVKASQFYPKYSLNEAKDHLTYEEKGVFYQIEDSILDQTITIDQKGMLTSLEQHAKGATIETNVTDITQSANYVY